eukprot:5372477-Amphidinium_carterae.1
MQVIECLQAAPDGTQPVLWLDDWSARAQGATVCPCASSSVRSRTQTKRADNMIYVLKTSFSKT